MPRIDSPAGVYVVEATAGSGKTQLALQLLHTAACKHQRARYGCFNRPLAGHIARLAPARAEVGTLHELAIDALRATGVEPDFTSEATFRSGIGALLAASDTAPATLDLLIIDESQDFESDWLQALLPRLRSDGRLYVLGDAQQAIYQKEAFELSGATRIVCHDNYRSPRRVVQAINALGLTDVVIESHGPEVGEAPGLHVNAATDPGGLKCVESLVTDLLRGGQRLGDIVILSFRGRERFRLLAMDALGSHPLRRFTGGFDKAGNPSWTPGTLLAESVYRFKGQSAPVVIVCEIDFEVLDRAVRSKLFVAMTRALAELHLVMSESAERVLAERLTVAPPT